MKLPVDMNLSPQWVKALVAAGFEATHWSEIGEGSAEDSTIFAAARRRNEVVFTNDLDFGTVLSQTSEGKPSVIQLRIQDVSPQTQAASVAAVLRKYAAELDRGAIVTIEPARARVRILPLR